MVDGTGEPGIRADVLVRDGRIAFVGALDAEAAAAIEAAELFDAAGLVVAPGFIDAHAHGAPLEDPAFHNFLAMGVTTVVLGQDGDSPDAATLAGHLDAVDAAQPGDVVMLSPACASFDQFRDFEARGDCFRQIVTALIAEKGAA